MISRKIIAVSAAVILAATACSSVDQHDTESDQLSAPQLTPTSGSQSQLSPPPEARAAVTTDTDPLDAVSPAVTLPFTWEASTILDTKWSVLPEWRDDLFVSYTAPTETDDRLTYSVVDSFGDVRWSTTRPAACTGFAVSRSAEAPIVVLTDSDVTTDDSDDETTARWTTTASAYLLASGEKLWGPVPVPGSVQGPGLVFGSSAPAGTLGEVGPRLALDPSSGAVIADESTDQAMTIVGEYDGILVLGENDSLTAIDSADGSQIWTQTIGAAPLAVADVLAPPGAVVVQSSDFPDNVLLDLQNGTVLAQDVSGAGYEPLTDTWVWLSGQTIAASGPLHDPWDRQVADTPRLFAVGTGLIYVTFDNTVHVFNAVTGMDAQAYPRPAGASFALPRAISQSAAAIFTVDDTILLATVEQQPR